jgi:hypothetical protein
VRPEVATLQTAVQVVVTTTTTIAVVLVTTRLTTVVAPLLGTRMPMAVDTMIASVVAMVVLLAGVLHLDDQMMVTAHHVVATRTRMPELLEGMSAEVTIPMVTQQLTMLGHHMARRHLAVARLHHLRTMLVPVTGRHPVSYHCTILLHVLYGMRCSTRV